MLEPPFTNQIQAALTNFGVGLLATNLLRIRSLNATSFFKPLARKPSVSASQSPTKALVYRKGDKSEKQ